MFLLLCELFQKTSQRKEGTNRKKVRGRRRAMERWWWVYTRSGRKENKGNEWI